MMFPTSAITDDPMKNHRRPKTIHLISQSPQSQKGEGLLSDKRPTSASPSVNPKVHAKATHVILGEPPGPPNAILISERVFAGKTHPRYPLIWAKHVA